MPTPSDRLIHTAYVIELQSPSLRETRARAQPGGPQEAPRSPRSGPAPASFESGHDGHDGRTNYLSREALQATIALVCAILIPLGKGIHLVRGGDRWENRCAPTSDHDQRNAITIARTE